MTPILIKDVSKQFGQTLALDRTNLRVEAGELFFLLGPSGCGKTTLLRILAGFVQPDAGDVYFGEQRITPLPPRSRGAGLVFQTYALWPHMTVADNVAYGLRVRGRNRAEIKERVARVLKLVRMDGFEQRRPTQLSGGQQQRVALARALVIEPRVLLLDEPLSNLDARLRDELREEIRRVHHETGLTMVYVTHDQKEAMALASRLAVMDRGHVRQVGTPAEVYNRPATRFVAGFLGESNFIPGTVRGVDASGVIVETTLGPLTGVAAGAGLGVGTAVECSVRPQALAPSSSTEGRQAGGDGPNRIAGRVEQVTFLGELQQVRVLAAGGTSLSLLSLPDGGRRFPPGETVTLTVPPEQVVVLARD
jgi:iron(III) transport system ATP-binding protein